MKPHKTVAVQRQGSRFVKKNSGFSIVEILIALGIISVLALAMTTLITNQTSNLQAIDEKVALQGIRSQTLNMFSSSVFCGCFMGSARTFDYTTKVWNTFPNSIGSSYDAACAAVGSAYFAVGTPMSPRLVPTGMSMENITETVVSSGKFSANLILRFDQTLLSTTRKSLTLPINFTVNMADPIAARRFGTCSSSGAADPVWTKNPDNSISFTGANVGIGTTTPKTALDVVGALTIGDTAQVCDASLLGSMRNVNSAGFAPQSELQQCRRKGTVMGTPLEWIPVAEPAPAPYFSGEALYNSGGNASFPFISIAYMPNSLHVVDVAAIFCGSDDVNAITVTDTAGFPVLTMHKRTAQAGCMYMPLTNNQVYWGPAPGGFANQLTLNLPAGITATDIRWRVVIMPKPRGY